MNENLRFVFSYFLFDGLNVNEKKNYRIFGRTVQILVSIDGASTGKIVPRCNCTQYTAQL